MADLLSIGVTGLRASQASLSVTGHNITNANTAGFSRQDATQATNLAQFTGAGYIGTGTTLTDVRRSYSEYLTSQLHTSTSLSSDVASYNSQISQLDSLLASSTTSVTSALNSFFSAMQTAAEDPANLPARQLVLSEAEGMAKRLNTVGDQLSSQNGYVNRQMTAITNQVNSLAQTIGSLNKSISSASSTGATPNDLLDQRDEALRQLSSLVGMSVVAQDGKSVNVFIGSGQPLVVGSDVNRIEAVNGDLDPTRSEIQLVSGHSRQTVTSQLSGGELGGLIRYRNEVLDATQNAIGRLALSVSSEINTQLSLGLDLSGRPGSALFADMNSEALMALRVRGAASNQSGASGAVAITDTQLLTASDYRLTYVGPGYTAQRQSDGAMIRVSENATTGELSFADAQGRDQGFTLAMNGAPGPGESFLVQPTRRGAADISVSLSQSNQLAFAAPLRSGAGGQNAGTGAITQPELLSTPNLAGLNGTQVTLQYGVDAMGVGSFSSVPAGAVSWIDSSGTPTTPQPFTSGEQNTYRLELADGTRLQVSLSGRPKEGDTFSLAFNDTGVSDNRNALKLVELQTKQTVGVGMSANGIATGASFNDSYGELVERVGTLTAQGKQDSVATTAVLKQATDSRDSLSGVNLDEEAANLIKFEQYYNASAQIIQVARGLFDTLLNSVR